MLLTVTIWIEIINKTRGGSANLDFNHPGGFDSTENDGDLYI